MKIARCLADGAILCGRLIDDSMLQVIEGNLFGDWRLTEKRVRYDRLLAPIVPTDILCIGLNYRAHAAETGSAIPQTPMLFIKASGTLNDPGSPIVIPHNSSGVDYEAELCVIIAKAARHVTKERALDYVFGYTCANDVSARDWQKEKSLGGGQFARGKSFDTFCPIGPWIVTQDEIANPNDLRIRCVLDGNLMQESSTADMIFSVPELIASLSQTMTLRPGAIVLTGTPSGVGVGRKPPVWLKDGSRVSVEIEGIGTLTNVCIGEAV